MRQPFLEQMSPAEMKLSLTDSTWLVKAKPPESSVEVSGAGDTPDASITDAAAVLGPVTSTTSTPDENYRGSRTRLSGGPRCRGNAEKLSTAAHHFYLTPH